MAHLGEIQTRGEITDVRQLVNYMYQLEEQVRYALNNLDGDNIQEGAIHTEQLSAPLNARLQGMERAIQNGVEKLNNEALTIDRQGVRQSKGCFKSHAGAESYLRWGGTANAPALSLDGGGHIAARSLTLSGGAPAEKVGESLPFRVYIGFTPPEETGILWIKPGEAENGNHPCQVIYIPVE